jgi:prepilin-type N-terminal cleavage/methylation domain-containing protein
MNPHSLRRRLRAGFTMIEVLLVCAMIGVMVAIIGPKFRINESTEVQLAGMQIVQDLELARTRALATRSNVRFLFEPGATPGAYAGYLDHDGNGVFAQSVDEMRALRGFGRRELPSRVEFGRGSADPLPTDGSGSDVTFADNRILFNTRGITEPLGTSGVIYLTHTADESKVTAIAVSGSGAVRLWTWRNGEWQ